MNAEDYRKAKKLREQVAKLSAVPKNVLSPIQPKTVEKKIFYGKPGERGPKGDKGERGYAGVDGANGKDGVNGANGINALGAESETAHQVAEKLNTLEGAIDAKVIKNLPENTFDIKDLKHGGKHQLEMRDIKGARLDRPNGGFNMNDQRWHGGGGSGGGGTGTVTNVSSANTDATVATQTTTPVITIVASPVTRALKSATTTVDVSAATAPTNGQVLTATGGTAATWQTPASATSFVDNEIVNGSGTSFTLANTPIAGSVHLYGNGQRLTPGGVDFTIVGTAITMVNSFSTGTVLADYRK